MKVKELMRLLSQEDPEAEVLLPVADSPQEFTPLARFEVAKFTTDTVGTEGIYGDEVWADPMPPDENAVDTVPALLFWPESS
jgi:hypothetical protein